MSRRGQRKKNGQKAKDHNASRQTKAQSMPPDVSVSGEISIQPSPKESLARTTQQKKQKSQEDKKRFLEVASFWVLTIYATITLWMAISNQMVVNNFVKDQRPYVGVVDGALASVVQGPYPMLGSSVLVENFGKTPAAHIKVADTILNGPDPLREADAWFERQGNGPLDESRVATDDNEGRPVPVHLAESSIMPTEKTRYTFTGTSQAGDASAAYVMVVRIQYSDMLGNTYYTNSCILHLAQQTTVNRCGIHNDIT